MYSTRLYPILLFLGLILPINLSWAIENTTPTDSTTTQTSESDEPVKQTSVNPLRLASKIVASTAIGLGAHYVLEYISVFCHEHGHGLTGNNPDYTAQVIPTTNYLAPWIGQCNSNSQSFLSTASGPLAGLCARYIQCIILEALHGYAQGKSLKESAEQGLQHPFLFFSRAKQTAKDYCSYFLSKKTDTQLEEPSMTSTLFNTILLLRSGAMIGEFIYGFLPYKLQDGTPLSPFQGSVGDGEKLWKIMLGNNCPTFSANLPMLVLAITISPFLVGALEAWLEKDQENAGDNATQNESTEQAAPQPFCH